jgi:hypothetical protein
LTLLDERASDDWLLQIIPPDGVPSPAFTITLPDGQRFTDVLPAALLQGLPHWPGTEPVHWTVPGLWGEEPTAAPPPPSPEVLAFQRAVTGLGAADLSARSDGQALADLEALLQAAERLRVLQLDRLVDAQNRNLARLDDEVSLRTWVRRRFDDAHRDDLPLSKNQIRAYPQVQEHVRSGDLGVEAAALICATLTKVRSRVDRQDGRIDGLAADDVLGAVIGHVVQQVAGANLGLPDDHPLLAELLQKTQEIADSGGSQLDRLEAAYALLGQHVPLASLKACLLEQHDALLPDALEERARRAQDASGLTMHPNLGSRSGGRIVIDADDETYELLHTALGASARRDPDNPEDTRRKADAFGEEPGELGADVESQGDVLFPRSHRQRGHDALKIILQRYLAAGLAGNHDKTPVSLLVTLTEDRVVGMPGALPAKGGSGRPLPTSLLRQWWGDASVTALVLSRGLIPLGITHTGRTLTAQERRASLVQHGYQCAGLRCCTPNDPLTRLIPHHVFVWATHGRTSIEETIWACPRLHMGLHEGRTLPLRGGRWINEDGWADPPR